MGSILSRFKRKKNTKQVLESLENEIMTIEKMTSKSSPINYYKIIFHSALLYSLITILYYFGIFQYKILENNYMMAALAAYPILALYYYKFVVWNYNRKKEHYEKKLAELKNEKKKILDEVMENETFKVAKEILEKYAPHQLHTMNTQILINNQRSLLNTPNRPQIVPNRTHQRVTPNVGQIPAIMSSTIKPRLSLPRPVLPKERTIFDRLADIILGDGPQNRYALICRTCGSHNGMARKEEFEYLAYRCAYCSQWNPSLKPRPALSQFAISYDKKDLTNNSQSDNSETIEEITSEENSKSEQKDSNLDSSEPIVEEPEDSQQIDVSINNLDDEKKEKFEPIEKSTALVEAS
ncbi:endoplasmic reticulum junction formation protein lunapark isoform X2 [Daktulosphaira vitifoliae]|uniref:endoplasmic reticulum junction formation protein lunapark isoform X2 n=1 Tax=Daktulosphaira vitifoliae TaxID=58002 RepID=UPI0021A9ACEF|nr:endoplasmic reticulum junction formation protein lunapark isoform X2 [Daktulosphaira vitifoliae]